MSQDIDTTPLDVEPGGTSPLLEAPADVRPADSKPKRSRPTTRAGRAAAKAARDMAAGSRGAHTHPHPAAPKADRPPRTSSRPKATQSEVAKAVEGVHELIGFTLAMTGRPETGKALADEQLKREAGEAWAAAAKRYPWLERLFGTSTDGLVIVRLAMVYWPVITVAQMEGASRKAAKAAGIDVPTGPSTAELAAMLGVSEADYIAGMQAAEQAGQAGAP